MRRIRWSVAASLAFAFMGAMSARVDAAILTVLNGADAGAGSLRQAIADATSGDTIDFATGLSTVNLTSDRLTIAKSLNIVGPGANLLTIQRSGALNFRIFEITAGPVAISGLTIAHGRAGSGGGGAMIISVATVTLTRVAIVANESLSTSPTFGGGIFNGGNLTLIESTVTGNIAEVNGSGGGIYNLSTLTIVNSTISGNKAGLAGRGIYSKAGSLTITGSTISGNVDGGAAVVGGGIHVFSGTATITSSTITANTAGAGGGLVNGGATTFNLRNTIVAGNSAPMGPDIRNTVTSQGFVLIGTSKDGGVNVNGSGTDQIGGVGGGAIDALLGPLLDNGGPTPTHALLSGSPAIERGHSSGAFADQRGFARPVDSVAVVNQTGGDGSDIGAYEVQADVLPGCSNLNRIVGNGDDSGTDSLRDVIAKVCNGSTITFAPNVSEVTLTTADLLIDKSLTITGPGAGSLTVRRSAAAGTPNFRILRVAANRKVAVSGMTMTNGNLPGQPGGGIHNSGTLALDGVALSLNFAPNGGNGGGMFSDFGNVTITRSTLSGNSVSGMIASGSGGAVFNHGGTLTLVNSTISGNTALGPGGNSDSGGGIITNVGTVNLFNTTITGNSGDLGGGLRNVNGGVVNARSSIIALNSSPGPDTNGRDINGPITSQGFNIFGNTTGASVLNAVFTDRLGATVAEMALGALEDNGGPTRTHALKPGSVAIDKGHSGGAATDQRGYPRSVDIGAIVNTGDGADVGAVEFFAAILDVDGNGSHDALTDGLLILRYLFGLTGAPLTTGAIGANPTRSTPADIKLFLDSVRPALDFDGNSQVDALTDGLMLIRYLFGLRGGSLTAGAIGPGATRTGGQIETYVQSLLAP